jgi:hypothetical protein
MPGLAGIISVSPLASSENALARMLQVQQMPGLTFIRQHFADDHCALLNLSTGLLPGSSDRPARMEGHVLLLEGELYEIGNRSIGSQTRVQSILLQRFLEDSAGFPNSLNGEFNIVIYNANTRQLVIFSDHLSSRPMFYFESDGELLFGSEKKALLCLLPNTAEIDEIGLLQLFAHEHNVGDRTFITGVKRLPPGSRLTFSDGRVRVEPWYSLTFGAGNPPSFDSAVEEGAAELTHATRKRWRSERRIILTLSGGLDSRALAVAAPRDIAPACAVTQSVENATETKTAEAISRRLGFHHHRIDPLGLRLADLAPLVAWRTEGETTLRNTMGAGSHAEFKRHGDFLAGGWLAECASGQIFAPYMLRPMKAGRFVEECYTHKLRYDWSVLGRVFSEGFISRNRDRLRDCFVDSWKNIEGETNIDRYHAWYTNNRAIRMTNSSMPVDSHLFEKIRPFYDRRYLEAVASHPWRYRIGQILYKCVIHRLGPEIRDIPESAFGRLLHDGWMKNSLDMSAPAFLWIRSRMLRRRKRATAYAPPADGSIDPGGLLRNDPGIRDSLREYLTGPTCDDSIFNSAGILELLEEHYQGGVDHAELIMYLSVLHHALDFLLTRTPIEPPAAIDPGSAAALQGPQATPMPETMG